ncbi:hypothetical protein DY000_02006605 [Brassica cretica]|uniref:PDZ domain-containing protein n=1 Tax=Brassica cretica TaxID=69181 RepID=A0ABQ7C101_BRACR|nr:hypothetical protein DY000_02006605 [Brassica cretica]
MKRLLQLPGSCFSFRVPPPASGFMLRFQGPASGLGFGVLVGKILSTSTTLLTGSGHDLQLISRIPPCSLKHIDAICSLQHIDRFTICSGHVPSRTYDSYQPQSYMLPRLRAH